MPRAQELRKDRGHRLQKKRNEKSRMKYKRDWRSSKERGYTVDRETGGEEASQSNQGRAERDLVEQIDDMNTKHGNRDTKTMRRKEYKCKRGA